MKKIFIWIILSVLIVGCLPASLTESQQTSLETTVVRTELPPDATATNLPLIARVTPNPNGQLLDYTSWELDYAIIDGERRDLKIHETLKFYFRPERVNLNDGCNRIEYKSGNGRSYYVATNEGEFIFPWAKPRADGTIATSRLSTLLACYREDEVTGEKHQVGIPEFMPPYKDIVAYELKSGQLLLYYPEDRRNVLAFKAGPRLSTPTKVPTQVPKPTMSNLATMIPFPTPDPAWTAVPPSSYLAPTLVPLPTVSYP